MGELVDDVEQAKFASVMSSLLDEVVGPDVVRALGSQADARTVIQPQAPALGLPGRDLQCSATIRMGRRTASPENVTQQATLASSSLLPLPHALGGDS